MTIKIDVTGEERLIAAIQKYPKRSVIYLRRAGESAAKQLLKVRGLRTYPPETAANKPGRTKTVSFGERLATFRMPYYERGRGTMTPVRGGGYKQTGTSEKLGSQWYIDTGAALQTEIGNRASYAVYVHGEEQARHMERIGWRKLYDTARDRVDIIQATYQKFVNALLKEIGLL
jgi:hypothetical protein